MTELAIREHWTSRHRGPYRFYVARLDDDGKSTGGKWLKGSTTADDVESEALALLADRRDTIWLVNVWSQRDQQFVFSYKEKRS